MREPPVVEDEEEEEAVEVEEPEDEPQITPKKKGLFGAISSKFTSGGTKRKNSDRSPQEVPSVARAPSIHSHALDPPLSSSPSFSSFDAQVPGSRTAGPRPGSHYEVERLQLLLNSSREDLAVSERHYNEDAITMAQRYRARELRLLSEFEKERTLLKQHIARLEEELYGRGEVRGDRPSGSSRGSSMPGASGSSHRGSSRRG